MAFSREPTLKNAYEKARQFDTMSVGCVFINVFLPRFSTLRVSRFPLTFSTLVYNVSHSPSLYFKSFLCRKSFFVFLIFLRAVLCNALDFNSMREGCGGEKLKNAYEKARQFDTMSVGCVFINVFLPRFSTVSRFPLAFSTLVYAVSYSPSLYFKPL